MNIFVLDLDPDIAATYHCDKHVRKMLIESAQMLTAAYYFGLGIRSNKELDSKPSVIHEAFVGFPRIDLEGRPNPYRISHPGHPCTIWTRQSMDNFSWHLRLANALSIEYTNRWQKVHAVDPILRWMSVNAPRIHQSGMTKFAQAMPACFRHEDTVVAYRKLYHWKASVFNVSWKSPRAIPDWFHVDGIEEAKSTYERFALVNP